ncbi:MAG: helix-turn-helix domain-containing protein, partial [Bradymonadaceae bacterium]
IGVEYLAALEDGRVSELPRRVYLRGYLRKIARAVDVPPSELLERYFDILENDGSDRAVVSD